MNISPTARETIAHTVNVADKAIDMVREGDIVRRHTSLELRDMQISMHEDFERIRAMMKDSDEHIYTERVQTAKWIDKKMEKARATADQALSSVLMVADIQALEKKVEILQDSVIQINKAYYQYEQDVDLQDLMEQVTEMLYRAEKREQQVLGGRATDERSMEKAFRGAIEALYGLQSTNPKVIEEARQLAAELRVYRDAAANENFHKMISKTDEELAALASTLSFAGSTAISASAEGSSYSITSSTKTESDTSESMTTSSDPSSSEATSSGTSGTRSKKASSSSSSQMTI